MSASFVILLPSTSKHEVVIDCPMAHAVVKEMDFLFQPFKVSGYMRKLNYLLEKGPDQYGLFAVCTPARPSCSMLEVRMKSTLFCSKNKLDLTFLDMDAR